MGDDWGLEDKYLKRNIPGRYNHWDRDSDEEEGRVTHREDVGVDEVDDEDVEPEPSPDFLDGRELPEAMRYGEAPGARRAGPKGKLAQCEFVLCCDAAPDVIGQAIRSWIRALHALTRRYKWFKKMQYQEKLAYKAERDAALLRVAVGAVRLPNVTAPIQQDKDDEDEDDEADEFMRAYRERRLRELKLVANKPSFGLLRREVSKDEYLEAINVDPRVVVVVHLIDPRLPPCRRLEALLEVIARRRPEISFISMNVEEAGQDYDPEVMPLLALYQAGEVVDTIFCVTSQLDLDAEYDDLERMIDLTAPFEIASNPTPLQHTDETVVA